MHYQLWEALCQEEVAPLVDAALEDLRLERTPGTLLHACMQAAAGNPHANQRATAEQLQRDNASLQLALTTLRAQEEQRASAAELAGKDRERLLEQQRENERLKAQLAEQTGAAQAGGEDESSVRDKLTPAFKRSRVFTRQGVLQVKYHTVPYSTVPWYI